MIPSQRLQAKINKIIIYSNYEALSDKYIFKVFRLSFSLLRLVSSFLDILRSVNTMDSQNSDFGFSVEVTIQVNHRIHSSYLPNFVESTELIHTIVVVLGMLVELLEDLLEDELMAMMRWVDTWMEMLGMEMMGWRIHKMRGKKKMMM